jgi:hypothetical protein
MPCVPDDYFNISQQDKKYRGCSAVPQIEIESV